MTTSAERTIHLGHRAALVAIAKAIGVGEHRAEIRCVPAPPRGWFVSPAEMALIETEHARRHVERLAERRIYAHAQRQIVKARMATRAAARPPRERALETWRRECADPQSDRSPEAAWAYARSSTFGLAEDAPMPREAPPERIPRSAVVVELAGRRLDGDYGRAETDYERAARLRRESRAAERAPSRATAAPLERRRG